MMQVQIAATVDRHGVSGLRWVLVDNAEVQVGQASAAPADGRSAQDWTVPDGGAPVRRVTLGVHIACAAVLLFALCSAWWVGSAMESGQASRSASATPPATPSR